MPAGTGVWVVKTVPARTASSASSKSSPSGPTSSRMRSRPRKPAWPSLVWNTSGRRDAEYASQRAHAADAEQDLLAEPVLGVAAVEPVGDVAAVGSSFSSTSESSSSSGTRPTSARQTRACSGAPAGSTSTRARRRRLAQRQRRAGRGPGSAPAASRRATATGGSSRAVEQADADERHAEVAGRLEVVAGEDAEAAGVLRQRLGDAELGREVGDSPRWASTSSTCRRSTRSARTHRKGRNNTLTPGPTIPAARGRSGAPRAATRDRPRSSARSRTSTLRRARARARLEVALDIAFQCSPDHPWVREHPEWFRHRPDGTIKYAENPPKKYQDIYPIDFESRRLEGAVAGAEATCSSSGSSTASDLPRRQPAHQAVRVLGVG
jgi:hypothetical protein